MLKKWNLIGFSFLLFSSLSFANQNHEIFIADDDEIQLAHFEEAKAFCRDWLGGHLPDAEYLKKTIKTLGSRLKPGFYWSSTQAPTCEASECRIQIQAPDLKVRHEDISLTSGGVICITHALN